MKASIIFYRLYGHIYRMAEAGEMSGGSPYGASMIAAKPAP